jgi:hypothetical protein
VTALDPRSIRRRFVLLRALRWLPTGMLIPVMVLLLTQRGLTLGQIGLVLAAQGVVVLALELPTGGLADALGRRPVLLVATAVDVLSLILFAIAPSLAVLVVWAGLQGVYRALESGPLDAWFVDASLAADAQADIERGLGLASATLSVAIAVGALGSGALVAAAPVRGLDPLLLPVLVAIGLRVVDLVALWSLMTEVRAPLGAGAWRRSVRAVPAVVGDAVRTVRGSHVLLALVSVELLWGFGMPTFETLLPPRLAEFTSGADAAAAVLGPAVTVAWFASAAGAAAIPAIARRWGAANTAIAMRLLQGATVAAMGLAAGTAGLLLAYFATYAVHGAANPVHQGLLHRQVGPAHRTTVLSVNSMMSHPAGALGGITLGALADATSIGTAMLVGAVVLAAAAPLYLPARRAAAAAGPPPGREHAFSQPDGVPTHR